MPPETTHTKKHEFIGILLIIIAVLLLLCLISYNPQDSSFNALSVKLPVDNQIGKIGAHVSDILFQVFGYSAYFLLVPLFLLSWKLIFGREIRTPYLRAFGLFLLILGTSSVLQLFLAKAKDANFMPGGVTGVLILDLLLPNLNKTGTIIVIAGALILGILASTPLSVSALFSRISPDFRIPGPHLLERFRAWREKRGNRKPARA